MSNQVYNPNVMPQMNPMATQPMQYSPAPIQQQPVQQSGPKAGVSAVNIQIFNPTASADGSAQAAAAPMSYPMASWYNPGMGMYPYYYPMPMPYPYPMQQAQNQTQTQSQTQTQPQQPAAAAPVADNSTKKMKNKDIVPLTDEYIKTLENYLNNPNPDVRMQGIKELLNRFKELDTRKSDVALTNLLNKSLQDPDPNVRFVAMSTLTSGYANGNQKTSELLNKIQNTKNVYGEDAKVASQALLKIASAPTKIQVEDDGSSEKQKKKAE